MSEQPQAFIAVDDMARGQNMTVAVSVGIAPHPHAGPVWEFRTVAAGECLRRGDRFVISGGRAYLADRDEAARRAAAERGEAARCRLVDAGGPCPRCEGTGKYQRLPTSPVTACAVCEGTGVIHDPPLAVRADLSPRPIAAERIAPGLSIAFDAAGRAFRWQPVEPLHFADEAIEPGDALTVLPDGRVRLADRDEAARRAAVERAIARHAPPDDDAPLAAGGDGPAQRCPQCGCAADLFGCAVLDERRSICRSVVTGPGDTSPGSAGDGADAAIVARAD